MKDYISLPGNIISFQDINIKFDRCVDQGIFDFSALIMISVIWIYNRFYHFKLNVTRKIQLESIIISINIL